VAKPAVGSQIIQTAQSLGRWQKYADTALFWKNIQD